MKIETDKVAHFGVSFVLAYSFDGLLSDPIIIPFSIGLVKEAIDQQVDPMDLLSNAAGIGTYLLLKSLFKARKKDVQCSMACPSK